MHSVLNATTVPIECKGCHIGSRTIYGSTLATSPGAVDACRCEIRRLGPQRTFLREGETPSMIYTLHSGWAFQFFQLPDGRRQILMFLVPGDTLTFESLFFPKMPLPYSVKSLTQVTLCAFSLEDMVKLTHALKPLQTEAEEDFRRYMSGITRRVVDIGRRSAMGRVAQLLIEIEGRLKRRGLSKDGNFEFPILQEHLADALGLTAVYVNRTLDHLRKLNIVAFGNRIMTIQNFERLHEIANEE